MRKNWWKWALGAGVALVVLIVGGSWLYIKVIEGDPAKPLSFEDLNSSSTTSGASGTTVQTNGPATSDGSTATTTATSATAPRAAARRASTGRGRRSDSSQAGYRVKETLFGQSTEAVGRTNSVTGSLTISGTTVSDGDFTVDMTTVKSDSSQRDGQFNGRIMDTSQFPTSTFKLTQPIDLGIGAC